MFEKSIFNQRKGIFHHYRRGFLKMQTFGDYYLPGRAFEPVELDKFLEERYTIEKIWLEENTEFEEVCMKHSFRKVESRK